MKNVKDREKKEEKKSRRPRIKGKTTSLLNKPYADSRELAGSMLMCKKCEDAAKKRIKQCANCIVWARMNGAKVPCESSAECPANISVETCHAHVIEILKLAPKPLINNA
jgi:hypothetical protein